MNKLRFLIVEENPSLAETLEQQIKEIGCQPIKIVSNIKDALQFIEEKVVDAVISNVFINGEPEGIQLAAQLKNRNLPLFFVTSSEDPAIFQQARQTNPAGYFVQPIKKFTFQNAIDTQIRQNGHSNGNKKNYNNIESKPNSLKNAFFIKQNNLLRKVPINNVLWIKTEGNYSIIHTTTKKYILKLSLKKVLEQLPSDYFKQIQRAYIVALPKIEDIDIAASEVIVNKKRLPLGRNYKEDLLACLKILK